MRLYCDGSSASGAGFYAEENGRGVAQMSYRTSGTSNEAEYEAIAHGLEWCVRNHARQVELFSDSRLSVEQIAGRWETNAPHLLKLRDRCRKLLRETDSTLSWVPREANTRAHAAAQSVLRKSKQDKAEQLDLL